MEAWSSRSRESANLLNPAFCCAILTASVIGYSVGDSQGLPFPFSYIILPIVLHKPTRDLLPIRSSTALAGWLENNSKVRIQFFERVIALKPFVQEAILFGTIHGWLKLKNGRLTTEFDEPKLRYFLLKVEGDARACIARSRIVGKWFYAAGTPETVMTLWEIKP